MEKGDCMEKNKILEAARKDKYKGKEFENHIFVYSNLLSSAFVLVIAGALFLVEYLMKNSANVALLSVGMADAAIQSLYEGIKTKRVLTIIFGSGCCFLAVVFTIVAIMQAVN